MVGDWWCGVEDRHARGFFGGFRIAQVLFVAAELGLADVVASQAMQVEVMAEWVGADPDALYRVLRVLASHGCSLRRSRGVSLPPRRATPCGMVLLGLCMPWRCPTVSRGGGTPSGS